MLKKFHSLHIWLAGLAFTLIFSLIFSWPQGASAATLNIFADKQSLSIGDEFNVDVKIDSENVGINAAQAVLQFSADSVSAIKVDKTDSVFNFWLVEPAIDNTLGTVSFIGGSSSGFSGASLQVLRVTFKVKGTGAITMTFNDSAVTAADGSGTNVLSATKGLELKSVSKAEIVTGPVQIDREPEIAANAPAKPEIIVPLYPKSADWHNLSSDFSASWKLPRDVTGVAAVLNKAPTTSPTVSEGLFDNKSFGALANGVWYIHARFKNNIGWGATNHYRIAIDTVPPLPFKIEKIEDGTPLDNPTPEINFESKDQFSGIDSYLVQIDQALPIRTEKNSYTFTPLPPGQHFVKVTAQDKAGNKTESTLTFDILPIIAPKILAVSRDVYVGEGGLAVNGIAEPTRKILVALLDKRGNIIYQTETASGNEGFWSLSIDQALKKGSYYVEVKAQDERGAESLPVRSEEIALKERPVLMLAGFGLTYKWFVVLLVVIVIASFAFGSWSRKAAKESRQRRILIAERDVNAQLLNIKRDILKVLDEHKIGGQIDPKVENEVNFILKKIDLNINKNKDYILENIEEIG